MRIDLIPAEENDAEQLAELRVAAMRESLERIGRFDAQRARRRFLSSYSAIHTRHIVEDGQRVGFVVVKPVDDGLLLDHLYIHPEQQGRGIGSLVIKQIFEEVDASGLSLKTVALKESDSNRFYVRQGFVLVEVAEWDNYYLRPSRT